MGCDKYSSSLAFCLPILVLLISGVFAFEKIDENLYLFLASHFVPPPACPENESWQSCLRDCSDCARRGACRLAGCARQGCDCRLNFVRLTPGGACVPVHECPAPECGENESFRECGPVCEGCGVMRCRVLQCDHRCYCNQGHLRDRGGKCVPEEHCPPKSHCIRNEEQRSSGRKDEYCLRDEETTSNATETKDRCYCREGFSRNTMGHCVADEYCAMTRCLVGEVYQSCPRKCNATCRAFGDALCEEDGQCFPGCFCADGMLMDDAGRCVPSHQCPPGSNPFASTAGLTSPPSMNDITPSTENDAPGSNPTTAQVSDSTVGDTMGLLTDAGDAETSSTVTVTSRAITALEGIETSTTTDRNDEPKDQADDSTKDPYDDSTKNQDDDGTKNQDAESTMVQDDDSTMEKHADGANNQDDDNLKDQDDDSANSQDDEGVKDQDDDQSETSLDADVTKDRDDDQSEALSEADITKDRDDDQSEASSEDSDSFSQFQVEDEAKSAEDIQQTTVKPISSKTPPKGKKDSSKVKKATTPEYMDEENE